MRADLDELCDALDAAVFSGDGFLNREAIKEFREYMARWERGLKEHEDVLVEMESDETSNNNEIH